MKKVRITLMALACLAALLHPGPEVQAGCGCDHPTPCPAPVMPAFASPGDRIKLTGSDFSTAANGNQVVFGSGYNRMVQKAAARTPETLFVNAPAKSYSRFLVGPMPIEVVKNSKSVENYVKDDFTYLDLPLPLEEGDGHYLFSGYRPAVDTFGVLYIPLDLSKIQAATNFLVFVENLPLDFTAEDVVIFNKDGFNLNLFTLDVEGYEKQWGDWYGAQSLEGSDPRDSDLLTYWRHDFYDYTEAHRPGGPYAVHEENEDGYLLHADGSLHVDHGRLIVAVGGRLRNPKKPDQAPTTLLKPGAADNVYIHVLQLRTEDPNVWENLSPEQEKILTGNLKLATPYTVGFISLGPTGTRGFDFSLPFISRKD